VALPAFVGVHRDKAAVTPDFGVQVMTPTFVYFTWQDVSSDESEFKIALPDNGGVWRAIGTAATNISRWRHGGCSRVRHTIIASPQSGLQDRCGQNCSKGRLGRSTVTDQPAQPR